jgi:hypothetical protein
MIEMQSTFHAIAKPQRGMRRYWVDWAYIFFTPQSSILSDTK